MEGFQESEETIDEGKPTVFPGPFPLRAVEQEGKPTVLSGPFPLRAVEQEGKPTVFPGPFH